MTLQIWRVVQRNEKSKYPHGWLDDNANNDWSKYITYVVDSNHDIWEVTLHVSLTDDNRNVLYDITVNTQKVEQEVNSSTSPLDNKVASGGGKVNASERKSKKDSIDIDS